MSYLQFDSRYRKKLYTHAGIYQQILLAKCHKNSTVPGRGGGVDSVFESADSFPLKLTQLPAVRSDFHEPRQGPSTGKYLQVCRELFTISTVEVEIWQIFIFCKANWKPRP